MWGYHLVLDSSLVLSSSVSMDGAIVPLLQIGISIHSMS